MKSKPVFRQKILVLGCGFIGQGLLPLIFKHIDVNPAQVSILTADERGRKVAEYYSVGFNVGRLTPENYYTVLRDNLKCGDFLINLTSDVQSSVLVSYCGNHGVLYLDTCIDSWLGESIDSQLSISQRSLYALREDILAQKVRRGRNSATAVLAHGANPGIVSHFVKRALLNIAFDTGVMTKTPKAREDWARLAQALNIKVIHIAERDTQIPARRKERGEFVNTWSIDGFVGEILQPAELGWGSHENHFPEDGGWHNFGDESAIYIKKPGGAVRVRTWLPLGGTQIGYLITHNESISLASYFTLGEGKCPDYRPTVHFAYRPCDDALLSIQELHENGWNQQERKRPITDEIISGTDELGVLLAGNARGAYWYGSRLSINEARKLAPFNSATSLQVVAGVLAGIIWAINNPNCGIVEAEEMDFEQVLSIASPYLGELVGEYTRWSPLDGRSALFPEDIDTDDPWQFRNLRVV